MHQPIDVEGDVMMRSRPSSGPASGDVQHAIFGADSVVLPRGGPLYLQLKRWIEDAVGRGAIKPGEALPSERDLAIKVDVSRVTVRKAVQHLVRDGVLVQRHGSGTFVAPPTHRVEQSLSQLTSFAEDMARRGMAVRSVWLDRGLYPPSPEETVVLGLSPGRQRRPRLASAHFRRHAPRHRTCQPSRLASCQTLRILEHRSTRISNRAATARCAPSSVFAPPISVPRMQRCSRCRRVPPASI